MEKTLVIIMGIQGSGKSTFYHKYLSDKFVRVNLDTLKTRYQEKLLVEDCLKNGKSFAVDNTNPTKADRQRYIPLALANGYKIIGIFMEPKLDSCIARNDMREGKAKVPVYAITDTLGKLEIPSYDEGFDELYSVKNDDKDMIISEWDSEAF